MQRHDKDWDEYVDIEPSDIKDHDKLKFKVLKSAELPPQVSITSNSDQDRAASSVAVNHLITNLEDEKSALEFRVNMAKATLSSLREIPRPRPVLGKNRGFTCSNCHYKGHRMTACHQPTCKGYFECGQLALHKEHRDLMKDVSIFINLPKGYYCLV